MTVLSSMTSGRLLGLALLLALGVLFTANSLLMPLDDRIDPDFTAVEFRSTAAVRTGDLAPVIARIRELGVWGRISPAAAAKKIESEPKPDVTAASGLPVWKLVGLIVTDEGRQAVLLRDGQYIQTLTEGDRMPSGEEVVEWGKDYLMLRVDGSDRKLALYPDPS